MVPYPCHSKSLPPWYHTLVTQSLCHHGTIPLSPQIFATMVPYPCHPKSLPPWYHTLVTPNLRHHGTIPLSPKVFATMVPYPCHPKSLPPWYHTLVTPNLRHHCPDLYVYGNSHAKVTNVGTDVVIRTLYLRISKLYIIWSRSHNSNVINVLWRGTKDSSRFVSTVRAGATCRASSNWMLITPNIAVLSIMSMPLIEKVQKRDLAQIRWQLEFDGSSNLNSSYLPLGSHCTILQVLIVTVLV